MSYEANLVCLAGSVAGVDLSAAQYRSVLPQETGGTWSVGLSPFVLQNNPPLGGAASVAVRGQTKVVAGTGGLAIQTLAQPVEDGSWITAYATGNSYLVLEAAAEGGLATLNLDSPIHNVAM